MENEEMNAPPNPELEVPTVGELQEQVRDLENRLHDLRLDCALQRPPPFVLKTRHKIIGAYLLGLLIGVVTSKRPTPAPCPLRAPPGPRFGF